MKTYNAVRAAGRAFEVVLVGSDRTEADFLKYHGEMPWLALPFEDRCVLLLDLSCLCVGLNGERLGKHRSLQLVRVGAKNDRSDGVRREGPRSREGSSK